VRRSVAWCCSAQACVFYRRDWINLFYKMAPKTVLVTGGTGYIGSHCIVELLNAGYEVVTIDNLVNSRSAALKRVRDITGKSVTFYRCDLLDAASVDAVFKKHTIHYVIHFASLKAVGESMQFPLTYYKNNVIGAINLIEAMKKYGVTQLVFSSSCTVYGDPEHLPITEEHPTGNVTNVYGRTKYLIEQMLMDVSRADPEKWNMIALRYFNPVGAHPSGHIGEDPTKPFSNLMPYISAVAIGKREKLVVFGDDYDTVDGTGVRDYIHVVDLAKGHVAALARLDEEHLAYKTYNLGTGAGVSVLQLVAAYERVTGRSVPYEVLPRREGDIVSMYANTALATKELHWTAQFSLDDMCKDFWRWQTQNPNGYEGADEYEVSSLEGVNGEANGELNGEANGVPCKAVNGQKCVEKAEVVNGC